MAARGEVHCWHGSNHLPRGIQAGPNAVLAAGKLLEVHDGTLRDSAQDCSADRRLQWL